MNTKRTSLQLSLLAALVAALALPACSRRDETATSQSRDPSVASSEQPATTTPGSTSTTPGSTSGATGTPTPGATSSGDTMAGKAGSAVEDAAVTASINAELAKDPKLSALKIDVDTSNGRVMLKGTAPDAESRERATQIASAVRGVTSVDNQLQVGG